MRMFSTEAKVGVVVLAALAAVTWLSFQIGEFSFREKGYVVEAVFRTVSGLEPKAKVRMAGVLIGSVDRIFLKEGRAHVHLRIDDGILVREDSSVTVSSIGILSERFVEITSGSQEARALEPGAVVMGRELVDMDQIMTQLSETMKTVGSLTESISQTFGGKGSTVSLLMESTNGLVEGVNALLDDNRRRVDELLGQSAGLARETSALLKENRVELHGTIANLREFSATLNRRAEELAGEVTETAADLREAVRGGNDDLKALMASLRGAAEKSETAADALTSILQKVDAGTGTLAKVDRAFDQIGGVAEKINTGQGSIGRLVTDDRLLGKIETTVDSANRYLGESENIRLFLGYRGEYLSRRDEVKNYVTMKFQPRDDKYYLLELVDDPAGRRSVTNTSSLIERPEGGYSLDERTVVTEEGKLKFSVQFAKDFGPLTFRGGLLESQGGAGVDYRIFGDRARLSFEGWDFSRAEGAHFKLSGRVRIYRDVFLNAGVDDLTEDALRSAYFGAGILFSDEDLKYLMALTRFSQ